jgi:hypothetical protein
MVVDLLSEVAVLVEAGLAVAVVFQVGGHQTHGKRTIKPFVGEGFIQSG